MYLCAFMPQLGQSTMSILMDSGTLLEVTYEDDGARTVKNPVQAFYGDVDAMEALRLAESLTTHPLAPTTRQTK